MELYSYEDVDFRAVGKKLPYFGYRMNLEPQEVEILPEFLSEAIDFAHSIGAGEVREETSVIRAENGLEVTFDAFGAPHRIDEFSLDIGFVEEDGGRRDCGESTLCFIASYPVQVLDFHHRIIDPNYRGNRLGAFMIAMNEAFVQGKADKDQKSVRLTIEVEQLCVLGAYLQRGYSPVEYSDTEAINRVFNGDDIVLTTTGDGEVIGNDPNEFTVNDNVHTRENIIIDDIVKEQLLIQLEKFIVPGRDVVVDVIRERAKKQVASEIPLQSPV